jgi:hypothetical protein
MPANFTCPHCQTPYPHKQVLVGRPVCCTGCKGWFSLGPEGVAVASAAPAEERPRHTTVDTSSVYFLPGESSSKRPIVPGVAVPARPSPATEAQDAHATEVVSATAANSRTPPRRATEELPISTRRRRRQRVGRLLLGLLVVGVVGTAAGAAWQHLRNDATLNVLQRYAAEAGQPPTPAGLQRCRAETWLPTAGLPVLTDLGAANDGGVEHLDLNPLRAVLLPLLAERELVEELPAWVRREELRQVRAAWQDSGLAMGLAAFQERLRGRDITLVLQADLAERLRAAGVDGNLAETVLAILAQHSHLQQAVGRGQLPQRLERRRYRGRDGALLEAGALAPRRVTYEIELLRDPDGPWLASGGPGGWRILTVRVQDQ